MRTVPWARTKRLVCGYVAVVALCGLLTADQAAAALNIRLAYEAEGRSG